ncbi:MAG: lysozyme [Polaromonas sp.]|nr:lysozyme [Polaromonas sp.]
MTPNQKRGGAVVIAGAALLAFVGNWEGSERVAYADRLAYNVPTVCNGHTGPEVRVGDVWSKARCDAILIKDVEKHGQGLLACTKVPLNQNQYDALTAWAYNVGTGAACGSTLVRLLNQGQYTAACNQLSRWTRAGGRVVRGLTNRREAERALCLKPMPQPKAEALA